MGERARWEAGGDPAGQRALDLLRARGWRFSASQVQFRNTLTLDLAQSEEALRRLIGLGGARAQHAETWLVLFDLYRATGQQQRFDELLVADPRAEIDERLGRGVRRLLEEPQGIGALYRALEERKARFTAEGLFDEKRKRPLPYLPSVIGVITSPTGAVIRDILHRLNDRFPRHVLVWPVRVQGDTSAAEVELGGQVYEANCAACHSSADKGIYSDNTLKFPIGIDARSKRAWIN